MLDTLISSKTRIKLLVRLFLNPGNAAHLRGLADEFEESTNAVRLELNRFADAGMLITKTQGNKKIYKANEEHPLFQDINSILLKYIGIDRIIETIIGRMGNVRKIYLTGEYAKGIESSIIDLIIIGDVNRNYLLKLVEKTERLVSKKIRFITYNIAEWSAMTPGPGVLLLWENNAGS